MKENKTEVLYSDGKIQLVRDTIQDGEQTLREFTYIKKQDAVLVVPVNKRSVYLVRQHRYILGKNSLEFPGGRIEENECPLDAALRELKEETGLSEPESIYLIGEFYPLLSVTNEKIYVYLMTGFKQNKRDLDDTESDLTVEKISTENISNILKNGFLSGPDMLALHFYMASEYRNEHIRGVKK